MEQKLKSILEKKESNQINSSLISNHILVR